MTESQFKAYLKRLRLRGKISVKQSQALLSQFQQGKFPDDELPLPTIEAFPEFTIADEKQAIKDLKELGVRI